jgi:hypothetical protein
MEKQIVTWSYWLGLANAVIALVLRSLNAAGLLLNQVVKQGQTIWYMSFYKAALLFFVVAVATACYTWTRNQKSP